MKNSALLTGDSPAQGITREVLFTIGTILAMLHVPWFDQPLWLELVGAVMAIWSAISGVISAVKNGSLDGSVLAGIIDTIGRKIVTVGSVALVSFGGVITPEDWAKWADIVISILGFVGLLLPAIISKNRKEEKQALKSMNVNLKGSYV